MIEKIPDEINLQTGECGEERFDIIPRETFAMVCRKVNEIIDQTNAQYEAIQRIIGRQHRHLADDHKKPRLANIALQQKIAVLEQNNNALRQKCEEYLGKLAVAKQALEKYADEDAWATCSVWEVDYIQGLFLEHGYNIAKEALEQINRKED